MERNLRQEIRVGIFVVGILILLGVVTWIVNGGADALKPKYELNAYYTDVKGLKNGAVVRLAGIDIGSVTLVELAPSGGDKNVHVVMTVREEFQPKITSDSVAGIASVGILGDMYLTLTVGDPKLPQLEDGATILSSEAADLFGYVAKAEPILNNATDITRKLSLMLGTDEEAKDANVSQSLEDIQALLQGAKDGKGVLHTLLYDEQAGQRVDRLLANAEGISADVKSMTGEVRNGDGIAHAIIYEDGGKELASNLNALSGKLGGVVDDLKTQDSLAHAILYDPDKKRMINDLSLLAQNLREISESVESGEGTAGLLVKDPQLYEDLRLLFGGAQRNALLRAYVRSTVARARDEQGTGLPPSDDPNLNGR